MTETLSSGLTLTIPLRGETNWDTTIRTAFSAISGHDHTGSGNGANIGTNAIAALAVTTAKLAANAVGGAKIRLENDTWLRVLNAAGSADINVLKVDGSDDTILNADSGDQILFQIGGSTKWSINSSGHIVVGTDLDIGNGSSPNLVRAIYALALNSTNSDLSVGTTSSHDIVIKPAGTSRWKFLSSGHFVPTDDINTDFGSPTKRISDLYANNIIASSDVKSSGVVLTLGTSGGDQMLLGGAEWLGASSALGIGINVDGSAASGNLSIFAADTQSVTEAAGIEMASAASGGKLILYAASAGASKSIELWPGGSKKITLDSTGNLLPESTYTLGGSSNRWGTAYITTLDVSTLITSAQLHADAATRSAPMLQTESNSTGSNAISVMFRNSSNGTSKFVFPKAGKITHLMLNSASDRSGGSFVCTVYKNGSTTGEAVTLSSGNSAYGAISAVSFAAGDYLELARTTSSLTYAAGAMCTCVAIGHFTE